VNISSEAFATIRKMTKDPHRRCAHVENHCTRR